jgi:hypothetical protein
LVVILDGATLLAEERLDLPCHEEALGRIPKIGIEDEVN